MIMERKKSTAALPTVALVGRVNVGKSTLFNRLLGTPHSLVSSVPGTTRDTQEALVTWRGVVFALLDTGGLDAAEEATGIAAKVVAKAREAIARADLILFITDAQEGALPSDRRVADSLRRSAAKVITVVNKADNPGLRTKAEEFARLGFGEPVPLSAINGTGTGDLLDIVVQRIAGVRGAAPLGASAGAIRLAIIGKPNVGKSTLVNAILGYERVIVSPHAHTTREPVDTPFLWQDAPLVLIDTAGIRRKARVKPGLEKAGVRRSIGALERADAAVFVIDMARGIDDQDKQLASAVLHSGVGLVIALNKWDLIRNADSRGLTRRLTRTNSHQVPPPKTGEDRGGGVDRGAHYLRYVYGKLPFLAWAPTVFAAALNGYHVHDILDAALRAARARSLEIPQEELNKFFNAFLARYPLPALGEKRRKAALVHFMQTGVRPPAFELAVKTKERFPQAYLDILEKELRKRYDLEGTPIRINARTLR